MIRISFDKDKLTRILPGNNVCLVKNSVKRGCYKLSSYRNHQTLQLINSIGNGSNDGRSLKEACCEARASTTIDEDVFTKENRAGDVESELSQHAYEKASA